MGFLQLLTLSLALINLCNCWCGTEHPHHTNEAILVPNLNDHRSTFREMKTERDIDGCPVKEGCFDPTVRDTYTVGDKTQNIIIRMTWNVFCRSRTECSSESTKAAFNQNIRDQMALMNTSYRSLKVAFIYDEPKYIYDEDFLEVDVGTTEYDRIKTTHARNWTTHMNVFVTIIKRGTSRGILGIATFPFSEKALTATGGVLVRPDYVNKKGFTLVHEAGHCLGLYHTHQSVNDWTSCINCMDMAQSKSEYLGDEISDTPATPVNFKCYDVTESDCQRRKFAPTLYKNYMGYSDDDCMTQGSFTTMQKARVGCMIDQYLGQFTQLENNVPTCTGTDVSTCPVVPCYSPVCNKGRCESTPITCPVKRCEVGKCNEKTGQCDFSPYPCLPPIGLENCSIPSCNPNLGTKGKCQQNISKCSGGRIFTNLCCDVSPSPFCRDLAVATRVCQTLSHCCYNKWDQSCVDAVGTCPNTVPVTPFENINQPNAYSIQLRELAIAPKRFIGSVSVESVVSCGNISMNKYPVWFNLFELPNNLPKEYTGLSIDTCINGTSRCDVPTNFLFYPYSREKREQCLSWITQPADCNGLATTTFQRKDFNETGHMDYYLVIYSDTPGKIEVSLSLLTA